MVVGQRKLNARPPGTVHTGDLVLADFPNKSPGPLFRQGFREQLP